MIVSVIRNIAVGNVINVINVYNKESLTNFHPDNRHVYQTLVKMMIMYISIIIILLLLNNIILVKSFIINTSRIPSLNKINKIQLCNHNNVIRKNLIIKSSNIDINELMKPAVDRIKPFINKLQPYISQVTLMLSKLGVKQVSKEDLAKLGLFTLLSYGWVSNVSYITCLIISWIIHGKEYGISPLVSGQWKKFMIIYAALWAANNLLRPFRVAFAMFLAPYFENWVEKVEKRTGFKKTTSTAIVIFLFNICGTISYLVGGLLLATKLAGVPLLP